MCRLQCLLCEVRSHKPRRFPPRRPCFARQGRAQQRPTTRAQGRAQQGPNGRAQQGPKGRAQQGPKGRSQQGPKIKTLSPALPPSSTANQIPSCMLAESFSLFIVRPSVRRPPPCPLNGPPARVSTIFGNIQFYLVNKYKWMILRN